MRKLMYVSLGFATGCGLCVYFLPSDWYFPLICIGLLAAIVGIFVSKVQKVALGFLGLALGLVWCVGFRQFYLAPLMQQDGNTVSMSITARDYSYETDYGSAFDGSVMLENRTYTIRTYLNDAVYVEPGDVISGEFRIRYTPGGEESATYHPGKGIFALGYQKGETKHFPGKEEGFYPARIAKSIKDTLRELFAEDVFAFAQALLLGDTTELDYETDTALKISGIRHIVAVSGLHVTILYTVLSKLTFRKRYLTAILAIPMLFLFAAVAGFTPSVTRACIMVSLMMLAQLLDREYDTLTALSFAALVMLLINPMVISSAGFQMSVGCVAGIHLLGKPMEEWMKAKFGKQKGPASSAVRGAVSSVAVSLGAMGFTTPLCAHYFGTVSLIGVLTNLLTLWVVTFIFSGLIVTCLVSLISMKTGLILAWVIGWAIRFVLWTADFLAALPFAAVYTQSPYVRFWLVFVYVLFGLYLLGRKRYPKIFAGCAALGLCVALLASWAEPLGDDLRVTVLDVGQGQSILLESQGNTYLVDCGGEDDEAVADLVSQTLLARGISRLDGIILSHGDRDHAGGLSCLLSRVDADIVLYPATEESPLPDGNTYPVSEDLLLTFGAGEIRIFGPIYAADANENSLCVLFTVGDCDILITGDRGGLGEMMLLETARLPKVELLIAGHHGSKFSTTEALLDAVRPDYIFVSAGADNRYGHPAQEMLDRAAEYGCAVYRTDIHGTLTFRR